MYVHIYTSKATTLSNRGKKINKNKVRDDDTVMKTLKSTSIMMLTTQKRWRHKQKHTFLHIYVYTIECVCLHFLNKHRQECFCFKLVYMPHTITTAIFNIRKHNNNNNKSKTKH